jgi:uncharacterized protein YciI
MSYFAVTRDAGPAWTEAMGAFDQPGAEDHAAFMSTLAGEGLVLLAGPLAGSDWARIRVLLIVESSSEIEIHQRLADDPWAVSQRLVTSSVEPWVPLIGAERLSIASVPEP